MKGPTHLEDRGYFFGVAATAMRHILESRAAPCGTEARGGRPLPLHADAAVETQVAEP
jgi:hypothetical protein